MFSIPVIDAFPPEEACPFAQGDFGPLSVPPPGHAELIWLCDPYAPFWKGVNKDAACPARVIFGSDQQGAVCDHDNYTSPRAFPEITLVRSVF